MTKRIGVGIVGASAARGWAAAAHVPAVAALEGYELVAVATTREASARAAAEAFGARHAFTSAAALAAHPDVDLVVVSVKAPDHVPAVRAALDAGKHVLVEWPLAVTADEAAELAARAESAGVRHAVGLQVYASPGARFVRDLIRAGRIGGVEAVAFAGGGDPLGGSRIYKDLAWGTAAGTGNDLLTIMVGHTVAAVELVTGARFAEVSAVTARLHDQVRVVETGEPIRNDVAGQVAVVGRLVGDAGLDGGAVDPGPDRGAAPAGGAVVSISLQGGNGGGPDGFYLRITGTEGTLTVTPADPGHYSNWATWRIRLTPAGGTPQELAIPEHYHLAPAGLPDGPARSVAGLYSLFGSAGSTASTGYAGSEPVELPTFQIAARIQRTLEAVARAAETGIKQRLTPEVVAA
ncbi:Gfo/Idh/MocA family protein [Phytohabitans houttuyneae]|uniref:Oxidoreductase n=1 Tax=Phytohabitans houttuyneae TaxID=1076126 RepID=A0A6V8K1K5_9ACTN|nr:Gfo/Idh/MocA family oxidoreductase [Phytohabitans houttuyneae]GFJ76049.1 oxidoreductase [Phytohabitans houttuyneae]